MICCWIYLRFTLFSRFSNNTISQKALILFRLAVWIGHDSEVRNTYPNLQHRAKVCLKAERIFLRQSAQRKEMILPIIPIPRQLFFFPFFFLAITNIIVREDYPLKLYLINSLLFLSFCPNKFTNRPNPAFLVIVFTSPLQSFVSPADCDQTGQRAPQ